MNNKKNYKIRNNAFFENSMNINNPKWSNCIERNSKLYQRYDDIRSDFSRDFNRILHCTAYRRLKHKTQVFFSPSNDHICTRIEHVNHVTSISYTIANFLGLNTELTNAIAIAHDIGHTPFGHAGEKILNDISNTEFNLDFSHEFNGLNFVDNIETLEDPNGNYQNLNLTYAVRDGIVCHCGEVDEQNIFPRNDFIDLEIIQKANEYNPYTWEGCVVKISDKIAYLGRDIEDAILLEILSESQLKKLISSIKNFRKIKIEEINNAIIIHDLILDICKNSSLENGISLSDEFYQIMKTLKEFNYDNIYYHPRLKIYKKYADFVINTIFQILIEMYDNKNTYDNIKKYSKIYPLLIKTFSEWLMKLSRNSTLPESIKYQNKKLYNLMNHTDYCKSIIDYISGMTDLFAIKVFNEIMRF